MVLFNNEAARIQKSISETPIAIGADFSGLAGDAHKQTVAAVIKTLKKQKKPLQYAAEFQTSYECNVFLELNFVPVLGKKRELRYISIITQDVTSRKIFEKRSKTAEADVRTLLDHAQAFILSVDSRGYIVDWNNHCASTTGFSKNEILSQKLSDTLISHKDRVVFNDMITRVMENQPVINCELPVRTKEGGEVIILMSATPRTNGNREVVGATLVGQDITELIAYRRSMEELVKKKTAALQKILNKEKEAVEMKNRFVSIASHELRTPLSSIDFAASFIKRNASTIGSKKLNEKVEVIEKHVSYMSHLLEDVLNFNKNEKGRIKIIPSSFGLDDFIRSAVAEVMCSTKHSHHICVSANSLGELFTDEKLLRNVLINLLTNAVKFSPGKEEISLNVLDE
ncbi:MAG TPA: PAS domain-containing sensor histidine kinase, partial [Chryseosolibacter sp.]|nr:PAS domain-containing sensor histidine kinase [Chryseosolibacter sp.]